MTLQLAEKCGIRDSFVSGPDPRAFLLYFAGQRAGVTSVILPECAVLKANAVDVDGHIAPSIGRSHRAIHEVALVFVTRLNSILVLRHECIAKRFISHHIGINYPALNRPNRLLTGVWPPLAKIL